jgi:hypothetical protein
MIENKQQEPSVPPFVGTRASPLPIWLFVGIMLVVYGLIVVGSSLFASSRQTVLAELRPGLWWGSFMAVFGLMFVVFSFKGRSGGA